MGSMWSGLMRDVRFLAVLIRAMLHVSTFTKKLAPGAWGFTDFWDSVVATRGAQVAIEVDVPGSSTFATKAFTYNAMEVQANQIAHCALAHGFTQQQTVAILVPNGILIPILIVAMAKIGVTSALLNPMVQGEHLLHELESCHATHVLCTAETAAIFLGLPPRARDAFRGFSLDAVSSSDNHLHHLDVAAFDGAHPPPRVCRSLVRWTDPILYIFTSGTTGLPKAAKMNHLRFYGMGYMFMHFCGLYTPGERIYSVLPFFHSSGLMGWMLAMNSGGTLLAKSKLSASTYWADCYHWKATVIQYVGEICRFLTMAPPSTYDRLHVVRLALGNGLRPEVWTTFQDRFQVPRIVEFYAATESNGSLINIENRAGAVGCLSPLVKLMYPIKIVRYDPQTQSVVRDPVTKRCVEAPVGEPGELIAVIDPKNPLRAFDGYADKDATEAKIIRGAFRDGDMYFRSGDLLQVDAQGFVSFVDRIGDTFRWKGENVSTFQVANTILKLGLPGVIECVVFGVHVPHADGRAGMALLRREDEEDGVEAEAIVDRLFHGLRTMPRFRQPLFVRLTTAAIPTTLTLKYTTYELAQEGFARIANKTDVAFLRDHANGRSVRVTCQVIQDLEAGVYKL
ncbi:Aste57867_20958 [Aphanomyces stellatus]|uniref:Aste57867_20958 protein n=1 Tax=Aphanomyces stellatus TaxID=120398 RepID=A0A485LIB7_9STRA|nr:hypothetical protein As57867_020890 [Aphanomyces stellatus]VFT97634.1 Aste57867_20958 [Aphanomyces stellatus]